MRVVKPNDIELISSSVPENEFPVWSASTSYAKDAKVIYQHRIYKSLQGSNSNHTPLNTTTGLDAWWQDQGATNQWKMFDEAVSTQTEVTGTGVVSLTFSTKFKGATSIALLNLTGAKVTITVTEEGQSTPYWTKEFSLLNPVTDWWEWFFEDQDFQKDFVATGIPPTRFGIIKVVITGTNRVGVGHFSHGKERNLGITMLGITPSLRSYSKKETNEFGETRFIRRKSAKRHSGEIFTNPRIADSVFNLLSELDGVPALWIGDDIDTDKGGYQSLTVFGWVEEYHLAFRDAFDARISITIQGLI